MSLFETSDEALEALRDRIRAVAAMVRPPPLLTVSQWADRYRQLSPESSAEPGQWRTDRAPYAREVMDCLSPYSGYERVVMMTSAQISKTEIGLNLTGFIIDQDPGPVLVVNPTVEMSQAWSKDRLAPMLRDTPALRSKVAASKARTGENTLMQKTFRGGHITLAGANSPAGLAARPIRYLILDEVDRYPPSAGAEGDPVLLAVKRTTTFWNRKILMVSTPTIAGKSRIEAEFLLSDQRRYWVPCPECGEKQVLKWPQVRWPKDEPDKAVYVCEHCGAGIGSHRKLAMLSRGEWRAENSDSKIAGFHINELYSPWRSFGETARAFVEAQGKPDQLRTFVNTSLGETWQERGEAPDWQRVYERREDYIPGMVPAGGLLLTAGVDTQDDRLEVSIWAWGRNRERWLVDHRILHGIPADGASFAALDEILLEEFEHALGGSLPIRMTAIDTAGHFTQHVYAWCRKHAHDSVVGIRGEPTQGAALVGRPKGQDIKLGGTVIKGGLRVYPVYGSVAKSELYADLKKPAPMDGEDYPEGYVHLPRMDAEYCQQLCAEQLVTRRDRRGYSTTEWQKLRDRNEALDCAVYARAAAALVGIDRFSAARWDEYEAALTPVVVADQAPVPQPRRRADNWFGPSEDNWI